MPQDQQSGAAANAFGRETAPKIARAIGATMVRKGSNEATLNGKRIVLKCARPGNNWIGVSNKMLTSLHAIAGAFQQEDGTFEVIQLPATIFIRHVRPTRSKGPSAGRVGLVAKSVFIREGERIATVSLSTN